MPTTIGTDFEQSVDNVLATYVTDTSTELCAALAPLAVASVTLYLMVTGYNIAFDKGDAKDVLPKAFRIAFIVAIALSAGTYQSLIVDFWDGLIIDLTTTLGVGTGIGGMIDNMLNPMIEVLNTYSDKISINVLSSIMLVVVLFFYILAGLILVVGALGYFILTKIAMTLLFGIGPLFIFLVIFPATQRFLESWVGQVLQFVFLQVLASTTVSLLGAITIAYTEYLAANAADANPVTDLLAIIVVLLGCVVVFFNLKELASALSGGVGLTGINHNAARVIASYFTKTPSPPATPPVPTNQINPASAANRAGAGAAQAARRLYNSIPLRHSR